ncbi:MAG: GNAT family N-acetyltransferase [Bacteroidetes bacterium]|nr:GNAT family N-acetyltransferase [Bacteroidota bacterium]
MNNLIPDILTTERLLLREINPLIYHQVMTGLNEGEIKEFFGFTTGEEVAYERERFKQGVTMAGRSFLYFHLMELSTKIVVGWGGYHTIFTQHKRAELGYVLNEDQFKGKGYMKEALPHIIQYGFESMKLHRIEALIEPNNIPSLKLINRFGFTKEGTLRDHYMKNNKLEDSVLFSLLPYEYLKT